ncbi:zona pellucida sperm-binding protein 4-like [Sebastes fasciatus]|uniref:zona pellucida sperm-binding protein 4-like n=1 Tax=Sebastes fasciatus TaxID=394691 RepID=UPI003D9F7199
MATHWSFTALVALALLVGTEGAPQGLQRSSPEYPRLPPAPVYREYPHGQPPPPAPPMYPLYPQVPKVPQPPQPPQVPQVPWVPQVPKVSQPPQPPQVPQVPWVPQVPKVSQPPQPPQVPQVPWVPQVPKVSQPPQPPQVPQVPWVPQVPKVPQPPQPPKVPQIPSVPQTPTFPKKGVPAQPNAQRCDVAENVRILCGGPDISAAGCEAIRCCFDGQQCYFGKAVTVQCTKDGQFIVVVARDATLPNIDLESIVLMGQGDGCTHVDSNSAFAIYQFPVTTCGSVVMEEPGVIIYENRMSSSYEVGIGPLGVITRDSYYELLFQCRYIGTSVETVVVEVLSLEDSSMIAAMGPIRVHLRLANGLCNTKGCNEVDVAYSSFYTEADYPVSKVLRDPVYVEVHLYGKTDPNLVLTLGHCWTTTSPDPHSLPQWDILTDGCPYRDDRYLSSLVPVGSSSGLEFPGHFRRFLFKMFTFVDSGSMEPLQQQVYIHCSTAVCSAAEGSCEPSCLSRRKRDAKAADQKAEPRVVASVGPVIMGRGQ